MAGSVGDGIKAENANWTFKGEVAESFDSHVAKSAPMYEDGHKLACSLSDFFIKHDSLCYELGSSTGTLTLKLAQHNWKGKPGARFIGIEIEPDMVAQSKKKQAALGAQNVDFIVDDISQVDFQPADMIIAFYTVMFVRPSQRQQLIDKIYKSLNWGGAFLMFEKVRASDARFQDIMTSLYNDFKLSQGYSPEEIFFKAQSLKGVLEPFSTQGNIDLLKRAGFVDIMTVMKYVTFEGFLAIK